MALRKQNSAAVAQAQESQYTVSDITNGNTYIFTFTDPNTGATQAKTYTNATAVDTSTTVLATNLAAFLTAAAATLPLIQRITFTASGAVLDIKATYAGEPWSLAITGTATAPTAVVIRANSGPFDFGSAGNIAEGIVPAGGDDIIFQGTVLNNLYQSGVTFGKLTLTPGPNGKPHVGDLTTAPFKCTCTALDVYDGTFNIDVNASAITVNIYNTQAAPNNAVGGTLIGSAMGTINQYGGFMNYASYGGETETVTTLNIFGGKAIVGAGETVTTINVMNDAQIEIKCAVTTLNAFNGTVLTNGSGTITTVNQYAANITSNSSGTITTWNKKGDGIADFTKSRVPRTIGTANWAGKSGTVFYDSSVLTRSAENFQTAGAAIDFAVGPQD